MPSDMPALYDLTPFTLLDFPDRPAAIFWFAGCNLRCSYCYNPQIVFGKASISEASALDFLRKRQGLLEGVVLSGGECTLYPRLVEFCREIRALGFAIKLDTNAMRPDILQTLLDENLLTYVALDYKSTADAWEEICGGGSDRRFWRSLDLLIQSSVACEVRTTYRPDILSIADIEQMERSLREHGYEGEYYLQLFREAPTVGNLPPLAYPIDTESLKRFGTLRL